MFTCIFIYTNMQYTSLPNITVIPMNNENQLFSTHCFQALVGALSILFWSTLTANSWGRNCSHSCYSWHTVWRSWSRDVVMQCISPWPLSTQPTWLRITDASFTKPIQCFRAPRNLGLSYIENSYNRINPNVSKEKAL